MKQIGHLKREVLPSVRALVFWVLVNTDFSKASLALRVGQSSEKYFTATRFPSPSKSKMFLINGVDTWSNQDEWKVFDQIRRNLNTHTDNEMQSARAHARSKKPFISDNIPPCFTKKLKNKIKSSTNICVQVLDSWSKCTPPPPPPGGDDALARWCTQVSMSNAVSTVPAPFAPKLGLHDWRPAWCPKLRVCGGTCRNTGKATFSLRKKLWETLGENRWMKNREKKHRTDDKRSPKVYYYVPYRPSALISYQRWYQYR
jgi:hypothetical protein